MFLEFQFKNCISFIHFKNVWFGEQKISNKWMKFRLTLINLHKKMDTECMTVPSTSIVEFEGFEFSLIESWHIVGPSDI